MVPDFNGLRKQSRDRTDLNRSKVKAEKSSRQPQSFQTISENSDSPQETLHTSQTATAVRPEHAFLNIWLTQPSWSPIILTAKGWQTATNPSGKKVPLTLGSIESHYRRNIVLGKRFGKLTNYLLIDVDINSPFHPRNQGLDTILNAMENLGLCRFLLIRSSVSEGLHIYFPLPEPVSSWGLACAAHAALTDAQVPIQGGICELFPNKKAYNAEHNGHRLPLQTGSFLLDNDFAPVTNSKDAFVAAWFTSAAAQDDLKLTEVLAEKPKPVTPEPSPAEATIDDLPPITWKGFGQSNEVMKQLVNYGDRWRNLKTVPELAEWVLRIAPQIPGFNRFASPESKDDLLRKNWAYRWAKSHFKSAYQFASKQSLDHNAFVAAAAKARLFDALAELGETSRMGVTNLWKLLSQKAQELYAIGVSWKVFNKYRDEVLAKMESYWNLGLTTGTGEGKNFLSPEPVEPKDVGGIPEAKNGLTELLTARCVTSNQDEELASFTPPPKAIPQPVTDDPNPPGSMTDQLAIGASVRIVMPGGSLDGLETSVQAVTKNILGQPVYRLSAKRQGQSITLPVECLQAIKTDYCEPVLQATAAQLLQVLGKACPFVGPGFWKIRRSEVPTTAWSALQKLVSEA